MKKYKKKEFLNCPWIGNSKIIKVSIKKEITVYSFWHFIKYLEQGRLVLIRNTIF